jgi:hypothetical protein
MICKLVVSNLILSFIYMCVCVYICYTMAQAVSSSLSLQRPEFAPGSAHMGFMADKVAMGQVFLRVFWFSSVSIISLWLFILTSHGV